MSKWYCSCGAIIDDGYVCACVLPGPVCPNSNIFNAYKHKVYYDKNLHEDKDEINFPKIIGNWKNKRWKKNDV